MSTRGLNSRFNKLSLKKNRNITVEAAAKANRSSDVIILDDSMDNLRPAFINNLRTVHKMYSPIVINDSSELSLDAPKEDGKEEQQPSKCGNVSYNSQGDVSLIEISSIEVKESRPSIGGWSPAQGIICATPRNVTIPSTPKDVANESLEQCSIKKIQQSQRKLLNELYGDVWKDIPTLFKGLQKKTDENINTVTKQLQFDDEDDSEKENIRHHLAVNRQLYLTGSNAKNKAKIETDTEKKAKKKLYTEKVLPKTPDPIIAEKFKINREVNSTTKKLKGKSVTELVEIMRDKFTCDITHENLQNELTTNKGNTKLKGTKKRIDDYFTPENNDDINENNDVNKINDIIKNKDVSKNYDIKKNNIDGEIKKKKSKKVDVKRVDVCVTPDDVIKRLSFMGSLADNVPSWRLHPEAIQYVDNYKTLKEKLSRRLYIEFNSKVFDEKLDADMPVVWDSKLRSTAGTTTNRLVKNASGDRIRTSSIKLSIKVIDTPARLRDTLIHEMCHAATWLVDEELRAGHGPLWRKWARRALKVFPELGEISRCHDLEIHFKYSYKCVKCGYTIQRHSKSLDITKKCCGYCRGTFELIVNKKRKDGVIVSTPARQGEANDFALYVKENYGSLKKGRTHAQVMKELGQQFSEKKKKICDDS